ncbi:hypothetical protein JQ624_15625 [Bradyrhizobium sp. AUGA SZCCT0283]|nr:hypothetical protein [Bradyrhizobium sp. AUGA SZCCT0283]
MRYRRPSDGRPANLTLGSVFDSADGREVDVKPSIGGHLTLRAAHLLVAELKHEIALGRDPGSIHIAATARSRQRAAPGRCMPPSR